jgi:Superinfection immunity protein
MYNTIMTISDWVNADPLMSFALLLPLVTIYVMPMLIASERRHKHVNAIVVFNMLTGWTFFGWIISFVWALTEEKEVTTK